MNIDLLSISQAAAMLGVTRQAVLELVQRGRIPAAKVGFAYVLKRQNVVSYQWQKAARKGAKMQAAN
jgi:excisionase family DNA binding protein